jgi:hypothetical protein
MEPEGSLPCSQEPSAGHYPGSINPIHTIPSYLSKIHFNIVHPPTSWSFLNISYAFLRYLILPLCHNKPWETCECGCGSEDQIMLNSNLI